MKTLFVLVLMFGTSNEPLVAVELNNLFDSKFKCQTYAYDSIEVFSMSGHDGLAVRWMCVPYKDSNTYNYKTNEGTNA